MRRRLSTSTRVALGVTGVLAVGVVLLALVAFWLMSSRLSADTDRTLLREAEAYAAALTTISTTQTLDIAAETRAYLQGRATVGSEYSPLLLVRTASGRILSNSTLKLETAPGQSARLDPAKARRSFATITLAGTRYRVATVPIMRGSTTLGVFQAALPLSPVEHIAVELGISILLAGIVVVLGGAGTSALVARASLRPLSRVARTAQEVTHSSLEQRVEYEGPPDDVGRLVQAFNAMLDRLENAFAEQRRFAADASHELRTPLTIVRGHLELVHASPQLREEDREEIGLVLEEVDRMTRLVADLLALARLEGTALAGFDVVDVAVVTAEATARAVGIGTRKIVLRCDGPVQVLGNQDMLERAVLNLISNAVQHTPPDGTIEIRCRPHGSHAVVTVADDGPGIAEADLPYVFDRFWRASGPRPTDGGGSGLGLAIVQRLVQTHGGDVHAENGPSGGAIFSLRIPLATPFGHAKRAAQSLRNPSDTSRT